MIGGEGKVMKIIESKFGKRKYHQGHYVKGQWVFCGVKRDTGRTFPDAVHDRSAKTLIGLIKQWILLGTTIISDCWAAYSSPCEEGYTHFTINHSITFVDQTTGAHTNTPEPTWKQVKVLLSPYNRKADYVYFLPEYMIRQKYKADVLITSAGSVTLLQQQTGAALTPMHSDVTFVCAYSTLLTTDPSSRIHHLIVYCVCVLWDFLVSLSYVCTRLQRSISFPQ
jgi:hypothetical protein